jgi:transposase
MTAPLSQDLRARLVAAVEAGSSRRRAALRFAVSPSAVIKRVQRVHQTGTLAPARIGGYRRPVLEAHEARLRALLAATPDMTLAEIRAELMRHEGVEVSLSTIHTTLRRLNLRRKQRA